MNGNMNGSNHADACSCFVQLHSILCAYFHRLIRPCARPCGHCLAANTHPPTPSTWGCPRNHHRRSHHVHLDPWFMSTNSGSTRRAKGPRPRESRPRTIARTRRTPSRVVSSTHRPSSPFSRGPRRRRLVAQSEETDRRLARASRYSCAVGPRGVRRCRVGRDASRRGGGAEGFERKRVGGGGRVGDGRGRGGGGGGRRGC